MGRRGLLTGLAAGALLAGGCGGGDEGPTLSFTGSDEEQIAATVNAMTAAIAAGQGETACALMTATGQRVMLRVGRQAATGPEPVDSCAAAVPAAEAAGYDPGDFRVTVGDVAIDRGGSRAEAECDLEGAFLLVHTDGGWRVDVPYCSH